MLEEFKNKKVKILVGPNSGMTAGGTKIITSTIRMIGTITDYDNEFIKLSNVEMISADGAWVNVGLGGTKIEYVVEKTSVSLINRKNILTISLVEE